MAARTKKPTTGKHGCTGVTKKGAPCNAQTLKGRDTCIAHADEVTRASAGFGGPQEGGGRPRRMTVSEVERQLLESNIAAWQRPYWLVLGFDLEQDADGEWRAVKLEDGGAKLYGTSKTGAVRMSPYDDLGAMIAAAEKLRDRAFGKARQAVEVTGAEGAPLNPSPHDLSRLSKDELQELRRLQGKASVVA